jgi:hypothetical protein
MNMPPTMATDERGRGNRQNAVIFVYILVAIVILMLIGDWKSLHDAIPTTTIGASSWWQSSNNNYNSNKVSENNVGVVPGAGAGAGAETHHEEQQETCQWTALVGDSNVRELFYTWQRKEFELSRLTPEREFIMRKRTGKLPKNPPPAEEWSPENFECYLTIQKKTAKENHATKREVTDYWYMDHEIIILPSGNSTNTTTSTTTTTTARPPRHGRCHIISQYFVFSQEGAQRLKQRGWKNSNFCGVRYQTERKALPAGFKRPSQPDFVWFSHGLWNLPNEGRNAVNLNCTHRFEGIVPVLKEWQNQGSAKVVWQTLFPVVSHPSITNEYIEWDYQCQLETAKLHQIPVVDIYRRVQPSPEDWLLWMDYHWNDKAKANVLLALLYLAFGGETSYFGRHVVDGTDWSGL